MSEVETQKGQSLLVKATNLSSVMLAVLFYILSLAYVSTTIVVFQRLSNIDVTFNQVSQVINAQAQRIQELERQK